MIKAIHTSSAALCVGVVAGAVQANQPETQPIAVDTSAREFRFSFGGGYEHGFGSDLEDDGDVQISRLNFGLGVGRKLSRDLDLSLRFGYDLDVYDFSDTSGLAMSEPWDDIHTLSFGAIFTWSIDNNWSVFGGPVFQFARESGADWGESFVGGGVVGATYTFNKKLTVGGGVGVVSEIEDDPRIFPILILNWAITDQLSLGSQTSGASGRTGVELVWSFAEHWQLALGAANKYSRFRLDDEGVAPDGVGQEDSVPIWLRLGYTFNDNIGIDLYGGATTMGEFRLEDSGGDRISEKDFDPQFFAGVFVKVRF